MPELEVSSETSRSDKALISKSLDQCWQALLPDEQKGQTRPTEQNIFDAAEVLSDAASKNPRIADKLFYAIYGLLAAVYGKPENPKYQNPDYTQIEIDNIGTAELQLAGCAIAKLAKRLSIAGAKLGLSGEEISALSKETAGQAASAVES
ncbi:hypothetical protein HZC21_02720 [Candidatus Peregrinibacteria bacterium]|nr:hypothetical protein [Candidatus Peregrinibacteria bacterium]